MLLVSFNTLFELLTLKTNELSLVVMEWFLNRFNHRQFLNLFLFYLFVTFSSGSL